MSTVLNRCTIKMANSPSIKAFASIAGKKEGEGPMAACFDKIIDDFYFGQKTFEKAESEFQKQTINLALQKAKLKPENINFMFCGDLLHVITSYSIHYTKLYDYSMYYNYYVIFKFKEQIYGFSK